MLYKPFYVTSFIKSIFILFIISYFMSLNEFIKELDGKRVEGEIIKTGVVSLAVSLATIYVLYLLSFKDIPDFASSYSLPLFLSIISYSFIIPALKQASSYKEMPCMCGMMVGMTTGMVSGFLPGFFVASTNGMFIGGFFGVALGIIFGIWNGKCCGIMGIMEGIMAGFMGGLMGAMTAFMLLNDNLKAASLIILFIGTITMLCLNYLIYREMKEMKAEGNGYFQAIIISFILSIITSWIIVYGPRSSLFT